jgi:hypothetical protein
MDPVRYLVVYCKTHNYGKLISVYDLADEFDVEGSIGDIAECLQICKPGFFKKREKCMCETHGIVDIDENGLLSLDKRYGYPHEHLYPKGWKLKYYTRDIKKSQTDYATLNEYFNGNSV